MRAVFYTVVVLSIVSCANWRKANAPVETPPPQAEVPAADPAPAVAEPPAVAPAAETTLVPPKGVAPEKSLGWLANGNTRFVKNRLRKDGQSMKVVEQLASGQQPHAIILSCSDSRVPPELVFDQKLGEIFVVRTAGESLGSNVTGSVEYATRDLGARLVVVMGHTSCDAVKVAMETIDGSSAGSPSLDQMAREIHAHLTAFKGKPASDTLEKESWANARGAALDLLLTSKLLSSMATSGQIKIVPALYDLKTGKVTFGNQVVRSAAM
jgi:carbonic anhydrase